MHKTVRMLHYLTNYKVWHAKSEAQASQMHTRNIPAVSHGSIALLTSRMLPNVAPISIVFVALTVCEFDRLGVLICFPPVFYTYRHQNWHRSNYTRDPGSYLCCVSIFTAQARIVYNLALCC